MRYRIAMNAFLIILSGAASAVAYDHSGVSNKDLAEYYAGKGNQSAALAYYEKALAVSPMDVTIYQSRGFYFLRLKNTDRALEDFSKQISIRPSDPAGYMNRAILLGIIGNDRAAAADLGKACELGSEDGCVMLGGSGASRVGGR